MMIKTMLVFSLQIYGQNSVTHILNSLHWKDSVLSDGITWRHVHTRDSSLFMSRQNIHILIIKKSQTQYKFDIGRTSPESGTLTSDLAAKENAMAAVNASFFNVKTGQSVNWIKEYGITTDTSVLNNNKYGAHQEGIFAFNNDNVSILRRDTTIGKNWERTIHFSNTIESGPLLILNGQKQTLKNNAFNSNRHPRTCACITNEEILLLTADGRTNDAYGLSLFELTDILEALGCKDAINFDGGGSTTMYIKGAASSGVVNMPCDNKLFDHLGERKVSNALLIIEKK